MFDADAMTKLLSRGSASRPVFRTEAGFQHALAWEFHQARPQQLVRLEIRPAKGIHLDALLIGRLASREVALELKYLTASPLHPSVRCHEHAYAFDAVPRAGIHDVVPLSKESVWILGHPIQGQQAAHHELSDA